MSKPTAAQAYQAQLDKLKQQIAELQDLAAKAEANPGAHWGHVGDLAHANEVISEITDQHMKRGEFAE